MNDTQNQSSCSHGNTKLCNTCKKPMCADCGGSCGCGHSKDMANDA